MTMPIPKTPEVDEKRKAMIAAAQAYDEVQRELTSLRDQLHTAVAGLEAKNSELTALKQALEDEHRFFERTLREERERFEVLLKEERANVDVANKGRDAAYAERSDALAWLSSIEAVIERAHEGGLQPVRRKRNGKHADEPRFIAADPNLGTPGGSGGSVVIPNRGGAGSVPDEGGSHS